MRSSHAASRWTRRRRPRRTRAARLHPAEDVALVSGRRRHPVRFASACGSLLLPPARRSCSYGLAWTLDPGRIRYRVLVFAESFLFLSRRLRAGLASRPHALHPSPPGNGHVLGSAPRASRAILPGPGQLRLLLLRTDVPLHPPPSFLLPLALSRRGARHLLPPRNLALSVEGRRQLDFCVLEHVHFHACAVRLCRACVRRPPRHVPRDSDF